MISARRTVIILAVPLTRRRGRLSPRAPGPSCLQCDSPLTILQGDEPRRPCVRGQNARHPKLCRMPDCLAAPVADQHGCCEAHRFGWKPCEYTEGCMDLATPKTDFCRRHQKVASAERLRAVRQALRAREERAA